MYYVTMIDTFMSDWGPAKGKVNRLVMACDTEDEAYIVRANARARDDMENVELTKGTPSYASKYVLTTRHDKADYPHWYIDGYFKKEVTKNDIHDS